MYNLISVDDLLRDGKEFKVIEVSYNQSSYLDWHIPGAIMLPWRYLRHPVIRDFAPKEILEKNLGSLGISADDFLVLYSDFGNRYAFYAFWVLRAFGHKNLAVLNGGKAVWEAKDLPRESEVRRSSPVNYEAKDPDWSDRVTVWELLLKIRSGEKFQLLDVRYWEEYSGETGTSPEHPNEESQTLGHIPGAVNIPWNKFFDPVTEELIPPDKLQISIPKEDTVVYCRTGARASVVWYYLKFLMGFPKVRLYDGSWSEWGNMVGVPVEVS
ncbi:sulfurtransferase [Metallosphaera hakonensis]|uniref:Sulfurtransferase n=1 Tax=Metallosphaera hakonensis JCM 8857 = DSM 7519 TaxID=1293036 RepID=A0A2U9ISS1_9CREN|nr:sulfurtransferase [Metallosphaera hakonensis]AWR99075.1 sulfurtransferase [Metallosphaera hakonensis JCM 8857 = DSM 7519]